MLSKQKALKKILLERKKHKHPMLLEEIIKTFLYFNDPGAAERYLNQHEFINKESHYLYKYINAYKSKTEEELIANFLPREIFINLIDSKFEFKDIYKKFKRSDIEKEEIALEMLNVLYEKTKQPFILERIVKLNPFINKELYKEYAKENGIKKKDILFILRNRFCEWAFIIGFENGWINI
ncbi:hypothetical protein NUSPORA_00889 [Nucleospora cyclopteri]